MHANRRVTERIFCRSARAVLTLVLVMTIHGIAPANGPTRHLVESGSAASGPSTSASAIEAYYYFVHWVSMGRLDLALEQFDPRAWVVAGSGCPLHAPCVGAVPIRERYLTALIAGELPLPLADLRFDGSTVRTYGDTFRANHLSAGVAARTGNHEIDVRAGRIASLRFEDTAFPAARAEDPGHVAGGNPSVPSQDMLQTAPNAARVPVTLVHRITIASDTSWQANAIALTAGGWHINDADGAVATAGQLLSVVRDVAAIEIGGVCRGWVDGPTSYPCGFAVRKVDLAGLVDEKFESMEFDDGSGATRAWTQPRPEDRPSSSGFTATRDRPRFVAVRLPDAYLGNVSGALGGHLRFEVRAVTNQLMPSQFDGGSGLVILRAKAIRALDEAARREPLAGARSLRGLRADA